MALTPLASTLQDQINAAEAGVETRITLQGDVSEDLTIPRWQEYCPRTRRGQQADQQN